MEKSSCRDSDTLDADKLIRNRIFDFNAKFNGLFNPFHQDVK